LKPKMTESTFPFLWWKKKKKWKTNFDHFVKEKFVIFSSFI
jgi:hypothetical protein